MHYKQYKSILSPNNGMNLYRGCTHGCIYCDSRSRCYQMDHDFEDIEVKLNAPEMLAEALKKKRKKCMVGTGAMCDPYMHIETKLNMTRKCLEVIHQYGFGLAIQTKSTRILRDLDLLRAIHKKAKCVVQMTLTTYDEALCRIIEPDVSTTRERFEALEVFRECGIPTVVWISPMLPFINDSRENLEGILDYCFRARVKGIICFNIGMTLREGNREYFYRKLDAHFPGMKQRYITRFGNQYECPSDNSPAMMRLLADASAKHGVMHRINDVFSYMGTFESAAGVEQLSMFD